MCLGMEFFMKIKCRYCESLIDDSESICPQCGAPNLDMKRAEEIEPRTIEELQEFCRRRNIPAESMRFFIGVDYKQPRAFGIYRDGERIVVYKNKADGSRAIRYEGKDEAYAVAQIHQKMKEEIAKRKASPKSYNSNRNVTPTYSSPTRKKRRNVYPYVMLASWIITFLIISFCIASAFSSTMSILSGSSVPTKGYYEYNDDYYYRYGSNWYRYDEYLNDWYYQSDFQDYDSAEPITYMDFYDDYGDNGYSIYDYDYYYGDHSSGTNYDSDNSWFSNWDSNDDWDYDWDSGWDSWDTDWDSDW